MDRPMHRKLRRIPRGSGYRTPRRTVVQEMHEALSETIQRSRAGQNGADAHIQKEAENRRIAVAGAPCRVCEADSDSCTAAQPQGGCSGSGAPAVETMKS